VNILYSFNKLGFEEEYWQDEIGRSQCVDFKYFPFNHGSDLEVKEYITAQHLDRLYSSKNPILMELYSKVEAIILDKKIDAILVDNLNPYHPEFLKKLNVYKIRRTTDGPSIAYDRDIPYYHAFDMIFYHCPSYSKDLNMIEKLDYCGVKDKYFWPLAAFEKLHDPSKSVEDLFSQDRNVDVAFVGGLYPSKMELLASLKKRFGNRFRLHGLTGWKRNLYFNVKYNFPGWISPLRFDEYVPLYQKTKIGINTHLGGKYLLGNYRMFDLPANGVMQISDGSEYLKDFFKVGEEIESYESEEELLDKIEYYLQNDAAREKIARAGYNRVMRDYTVGTLLKDAAELIKSKV